MELRRLVKGRRLAEWLYTPLAPTIGAASFTLLVLITAAVWFGHELREAQRLAIEQTLAMLAATEPARPIDLRFDGRLVDVRRESVSLMDRDVEACVRRLVAIAVSLSPPASASLVTGSAEAACTSGTLAAASFGGGEGFVTFRPDRAADGQITGADVLAVTPSRTGLIGEVLGLPFAIPFVLAATALAAAAGYQWSRSTNRRIDGLERAAATDGLTGALRREAFLERLSRAVAEARRRSRPLSVLVIDVDGLKPTNDRFGHAVGDRALETVAAAIRATLRESDAVGRLGGDEFAALLTWADREAAAAVAERLRAAVAAEGRAIDGFPTEITVSIGVTALRAGDAPADIIARGDLRLYAAKRGHGNKVVRLD
jgi:diguanylate cyclase (GGDEF)-like protein